MTVDRLRVEVPPTAGEGTEIHVGPGRFDDLGELVREHLPAHRYAVVADDEVAGLYGDATMARLRDAGLTVELLTFPAGESHKTRGTWASLTDRLLSAGFGRDAALLALGGGVTGDLVGFVAATYMRGVPYGSVPTTLLAMVDSSVGGKTAVDTPVAKNAVGAFHHPRIVVIDPRLLRTLPDRDRRAGLAEAVKAAAIRDADLFAWIETNAQALAAGDEDATAGLVRPALRIKADVVARDAREAGERAVLNFGHTIGHAIEVMSGLAARHGEAVAAGMRLEARLGEFVGATEAGTADRLAAALTACELPDVIGLPGLAGPPDAARLLDAAATDKKSRRGATRWVLLRRIGEVARPDEGGWTHDIARPVAEDGLARALRATADVPDSAS